jgi:hypothetical protein
LAQPPQQVRLQVLAGYVCDVDQNDEKEQPPPPQEDERQREEKLPQQGAQELEQLKVAAETVEGPGRSGQGPRY